MWTWSGSTASRWPADTVKSARVYDVPASCCKAGDNLVVVNVFDMWGSGGCTARPSNAHCDSPMAPACRSTAWEYQLPPTGSVVDAARALGAQRGHQHSVQRHDRAARQVWPARRGVVPGRGQCRARRCQALPGATAALFTDWRRQFEFRCRSWWCSSPTGMRSRRRRSTVAGRSCAMRSAARWPKTAMPDWR